VLSDCSLFTAVCGLHIIVYLLQIELHSEVTCEEESKVVLRAIKKGHQCELEGENKSPFCHVLILI
jgi:hypothetical protein